MFRRAAAACSVVLLVAAIMTSCSADRVQPLGVPPADSASAGAAGADANAVLATDAYESEDAWIDADSLSALCEPGSWGTVPNTNCRLIEQDDCAAGQTCMANALGVRPGTRCVILGTGLKLRSESCKMPSECSPGLTCVFGYCSPFCCPAHQFEICGPNGLCMFSRSVGTGYVLSCSYARPCTLWNHDCSADLGCQIIAKDGSAVCMPPAGSSFVNEGDPCEATNDCGDNQLCVTVESESRCRFVCKRGEAPIKSGAIDGGPGEGGCRPSQRCQPITDFPDWVGVCI
jgi:hypothetical protein